MLSEKSSKLVPIITNISYQFSKNVASIQKGSTDNLKVVNFQPGFLWQDIYFSPGSAKFIEDGKHVDAGKLFEQKLSFKFPGDASDYIDQLEDLNELPGIVRFDYNNGISKLIGSSQIPAYFKSSSQSDANATGNQFQFYCNAIHRAFMLE